MARVSTYKYTVTVAGSKFVLDGVSNPRLVLFPGCTYEFDQAEGTNGSQPLRFATAADAAGSSEYTTGVTTNGTPGSAGAWTKIEVTGDTPYLLYYYSTGASSYGNYVNVPPNYVKGNRAIFISGYTPSTSQGMEFIQINTTGNTTDFGDMSSYGNSEGASCGSNFTRSVINHDRTGGASPGANTSTQEQITIASQGNSANFGNITANGENSSGMGGSNSIKGFRMGSFNSYGSQVPDTFATNDILFYYLATEGSTADFGDLTYAHYNYGSCAGSDTRMIHSGGSYYGGSPQTTRTRNIIDYWTIASSGNATDFGDLLGATNTQAGLSNGTRSVFQGGAPAPPDQGGETGRTNVVSYVTVSSTGNATDFGDLTTARMSSMGMSNATRGVCAGGTTPSLSDIIDYITIASTSNSTDFGDIATAKQGGGAAGDGHGGL